MGFENGHLARVAFTATIPGNEVVNTLHYDLVGNALDDSPTLQALADRLADDCLDAYASLFPDGWTIHPVTVVDEVDPQHPLATRDGAVAGASLVGSGATPSSDNMTPLELCAVATLRTAHIGRRYRGRMFMPPIFSEIYTVDGELGGARRIAYQTFINTIPHAPDLTGGPTTATADWVVYSRTQRVQHLDPYATKISDVRLNSKLHWLRSRGR